MLTIQRSVLWILAISGLCAGGTGCAGTEVKPTPAHKTPPLEVFTAQQRTASDLDVHTRMEAFKAIYAVELSPEQSSRLTLCQNVDCEATAASMNVRGFDGHTARKALLFWFKACEEGIASSCRQVSDAYQDAALDIRDEEEPPLAFGESKEGLETAHLTFALRACALVPSQDYCERWADHYLAVERPNAARLMLAVDLLKDRCAQDRASSCRSLAWHFTQGTGVDRDMTMARTYQARACTLIGDPQHRMCQVYATMLYDGVGGDALRSEAVTYFEAACSPDNDAWTEHCKGDTRSGQEVCTSSWRQNVVKACLAITDRDKDNPDARIQARSLRILSAMCGRTLLTGVRNNVLQACHQADAIMLASKVSRTTHQNFAKRLCDTESLHCVMTSNNIATCPNLESNCLGKYGIAQHE